MSRPIKILHVVHAFTAGGLENGLLNIINHSSDHFSHELCVLTQAGAFLDKLTRPIIYHELHRRPGNDPRLLLRIHEIIRKSKPSILHTRNWGTFDAVLAACFSPRLPVVHGEHGRDMQDPQGLNRRRNTVRKLMAFRIRKFVAVSADLHRWLTGVVGIPERKTVFIPNGVDTQRFKDQPMPHLRKALGIAETEFVVGSVGRLDPVKNHEGLIRAVAFLNRQGGHVRLVIVGEGPNRARLEELIRKINCRPCPILAGHQADVERYYALFDVFVLNSLAEGMSNTLLEAMAAGLPCLCTPVGGNVELIQNGVTGMHVGVGNDAELAEKIRSYQTDPQVRCSHGAAARSFVERNYSLGQMIARYVELYRQTA